MDGAGWHYFPGYEQREALFWETFDKFVDGRLEGYRKAIKLAEEIGVLFRYGFCWVEGTELKVIVETDSSVKYLDAFMIDL
ncbi:hypothetical protein K402DRAFT_389027 [Aulographum hederae CBS 113979]|uniref:Uncharacterized protein n=1 Tax=Aulographum hederae CBS 113979 TaxID=1176131 RepID=A0A6G1HEF9_9PEZI|nr:hypothetical protein K402DRAFT_389027 [Aulographum hederae CBS 113979]